MRFVVTGGGTGGHIYPALAIARGLQDVLGAEVYYLGGTRGMEAEIVPRAGFPFEAISLEGFRRSLTPANIKVAWRAARGVAQARKLIKKIRPAAVVGTGGYVCGPVVLAASLQGIPTMIHEQNALPGITNKILSRFVRQIALTFEDSKKYFPRKARIKVTGLPVRPEVLQAERLSARARLGLPPGALVVLSFGGSQGARSINNAMPGVLGAYAGRKDVHFLHVTGPRQYDQFMDIFSKSGISMVDVGNITITPYMYDMPDAMAASDLVICRAGAATLAELTVLGLPGILIPYPYAAENHQEHNARAMERAGAALVIRDGELDSDMLLDKINWLLSDSPRLSAMSGFSKSRGKPRALDDIIDCIVKMLDNKLN